MQESGHDKGYGEESPTYDYGALAEDGESRDRIGNPMLDESDSDGGKKGELAVCRDSQKC